MLIDAFPKLKSNVFARLLRLYLASPVHMAVIALLTLLSSFLGWEVPAFYCYAAFTALAVFFGGDATGVLPVVGCGYMSISYAYKDGKYPATAVFDHPQAVLQIGFCIALMVLLIAARALYSAVFGERRRAPRLWVGFVLLVLSYLLGGAFTKYYGVDTVAFGVVNAFIICFLYFTLHYALDWNTFRMDYVFRLFCVIGATVLVQVIAMYFREGVVVNGSISDRGLLGTGWGHYNSVGCVLSMCACAPLYFAAKKKHGWLYTALAAVFAVGIILTQSRGSILFGGSVFLIALILSLVKAQKRERIFSLIVLGVCLVAALVVALCFFDKVRAIFESMLVHGADDNGRVELFKEAWQYFLSAPAFGVGWGGNRWTDSASPFTYFMAHNTYLQLLGSLGVFGMLAYLVHRAQTLVMLFKHRVYAKFVMALSILAMILICFMDCHFFQCGPSAIFYSIFLLFIEGVDMQADADTRLIKKKKKGAEE